MAHTLRPEIKAALDTARKTLGVREHGSNRGPEVEAYLRAVDNPPGAPWCCAWTYWVIREALIPFSLPTPYIKSAYCPTVLTWAEDLDLIVPDPAPGDTFLLVYGGRARHTGFVVDAATSDFHTIEGNTTLGGAIEGDGVYERVRPREKLYRFVRWSNLLPKAGPDAGQGRFALYLDGKRLVEAPVVKGRAFCPARLFGEALGMDVTWDAELQLVRFNELALPSPVTLVDGVGYLPVRILAAFAKRKLIVDPVARRIVIG